MGNGVLGPRAGMCNMVCECMCQQPFIIHSYRLGTDICSVCNMGTQVVAGILQSAYAACVHTQESEGANHPNTHVPVGMRSDNNT